MTEMRLCKHHGLALFSRSGRWWRCKQCAIDTVDRQRKRNKLILVQEAGGKCLRCGYDKCYRAMTFHHRDPTTKLFDISGKARTYSLERLRLEVAKCDLLCMNCHMELETLPSHPIQTDRR